MKNLGLITTAVQFVALQERKIHPLGAFDKAGRWYPNEKAEKAHCCSTIRQPSRRYPYSLMHHCRTLKHVCNVYGTDIKQVRVFLKKNRNDVSNRLQMQSVNQVISSYL